MRVEHRLSKLEQVIETIHEPRVCTIFGDDADAEAAVAQFRVANNWPDDAAHPVEVVRILFGKGT
jgi:hypothetical protein